MIADPRRAAAVCSFSSSVPMAWVTSYWPAALIRQGRESPCRLDTPAWPRRSRTRPRSSAPPPCPSSVRAAAAGINAHPPPARRRWSPHCSPLRPQRRQAIPPDRLSVRAVRLRALRRLQRPPGHWQMQQPIRRQVQLDRPPREPVACQLRPVKLLNMPHHPRQPPPAIRLRLPVRRRPIHHPHPPLPLVRHRILPTLQHLPRPHQILRPRLPRHQLRRHRRHRRGRFRLRR